MSEIVHKLLVANRGEIAVRIIRAAQNLGIGSVAIFSTADAESLHVQLADEAICIGAPEADQSYLNIEKVVEAAWNTGCTMVHPGYGFLSENSAFAEACERAGLIFVGPSPDVIARLGSKLSAKQVAQKADVPCIPGYEGGSQDSSILHQEADAIGYPLMIKATHGGGGRGLRMVHASQDFASSLERARSEAVTAFGNGEVILEKAIIGARHVEVQILADAQGNVVHLFERDCSVQRRHQKVVEEAPSPSVSPSMRETLGRYAVSMAKASNYKGAGTVEFLVDASDEIYFLEVNTRLQVEHPVTELISGVDLVEWQLKIALGEPLNFNQEALRLQGHAIEMRLYAEDPYQGFLPQTGAVTLWDPPRGNGIRVDSGITSGAIVKPYYDPMLAKIIAFGDDRLSAIRKLHHALSQTVLLGLSTNIPFVQSILSDPDFVRGSHNVNLLEQGTLASPSKPRETVEAAAVAAVILHAKSVRPGERAPVAMEPVFYAFDNGLGIDSGTLVYSAEGYRLAFDDQSMMARVVRLADDAADLMLDEQRFKIRFSLPSDKQIDLAYRGQSYRFSRKHRVSRAMVDKSGQANLTSAMEGVIVSVLCAEGDIVEVGQPLIVVESMKMEHKITAGGRLAVEQVLVSAGQNVQSGQTLVLTKPADAA